MDLEEEVETHTRRVEAGEWVRYGRACPECGAAKEEFFRMHDDRKPAQERQPVGLAPSTVWRWLSWLGGMRGVLGGVWDLIRQKEPNSTLHRQPGAVSLGKYRQQPNSETGQSPLERYRQGTRFTRHVNLQEVLKYFLHKVRRKVHEDFSDVQLDGLYFAVDPRLRGDWVEA